MTGTLRFRWTGLCVLGTVAAALLCAASVSYAQTAAEGTWKRTASMGTPRSGHTALVLGGPACKQSPRPDWCGKILVVGGSTHRDPATGPGLDPLVFSTELYDPRTGTWSSCSREAASASCPGPRTSGGGQATLLADGKVLVVGWDRVSPFASTELYDPATGAWSSCSRETASASCPAPSTGAGNATTLLDGPACMQSPRPSWCYKVLAAGEAAFDPDVTSELYDPAAGTWRATGGVNQQRYSHTATLLPNGKVLMTGGTLPPPCIRCDPTELPPPGEELTEAKFSSELYDPATETWTSCFQRPPRADCPGNLAENRAGHTATLLPNGRVLVAGGASNELVRASSELYEPLTGTWSPSKLLNERRRGHIATLLPTGKLLVAGGSGGGPGPPGFEAALASAELYDPASPGPRWDSAGSMSTPRASNFGGSALEGVLISSDSNTFEADSAVCGDNCGRVLVVGGLTEPEWGAGRLASAELYTPPPVVSGVSPASGPLAGGSAVKVTGMGFTHGTSAVLFGGAPAQSFTVDSYGTLTAVSPPRDLPGPVEVTVVNEGGRSDRGPAACLVSAACFIYGPELPPGQGGEGPGGGGGSGGGGSGGGGAGSTGPTTGAPGLPGAGSSGQGSGSGLLQVTEFGMDSRAFAPAGKPTPKVAAARRVPRGSKFRYTLSRSAGVTIAIHRVVAGRRVGRRCRRTTSPQRAKRRCVRRVRSGSLTRRDRPAGPNVTPFTGRIGRRALRPGRYRATIVATDAAGERSAPRAVTFQILRAPTTRKR